MLRAGLAVLLLLAGGSALAEPPLQGSGVQILRNAVDSGGGLSTGVGVTLDGAAGETGVGSYSNAFNNQTAGLPSFIAQPGTVTSLAAVTKTTGTLELAWTAPGRDGELGGVVNGAWRIDYSSDPLHVFDPTVFQTQVTTTCNPGDPQSYLISGLLPNTTYYARVYLADQADVVAQTSAQQSTSTLANPPAAPSFAGVFVTSVTISWTLPVQGAEGYQMSASTTDFGSLFPGGVVTSSLTANGLSVTLTITGLEPASTYFFSLGSLDWNSDLDFASIVTTVTLPGAAVPSVLNLAVAADGFGRTATLTWTNPTYPNLAGVTLLVSSQPIVETRLEDFVNYPVGTELPDGSVVASSEPNPDAQYIQGGMTLNTTSYFALFERDTSAQYSFVVSTYVVLNLPPMAPPALSEQLSAGGSSVTLRWSAVLSAEDGTRFAQPFSPTSWELDHYDIYRSTGLVYANWTLAASTQAAADWALVAVPSTGTVYYYKVVSRNAFDGGGVTDQAMVVDTLGNLYALDADGVSRLQFPPSAAAMLQPGANPSGLPVLVRAVDQPSELGGLVVRAVDFQPVASPSDAAVALNAPAADLAMALHYDVVAGQIVPSSYGAARPAAATPAPAPAAETVAAAAKPAALSAPVPADAASSQLSAYYAQGTEARNIYGQVDPVSQTVSVQSALTGTYQIRSVARPSDFSFDLSGVSNRFITPNGDGLNDTVVITGNNPLQSAFSGKIYDVRGAFVSNMFSGPVSCASCWSLEWDGKANGRVVPRGVYIYQISAEGKTFNGTVVVIR